MLKKDNLKVGLMVLIKEDFLPLCKWALGRISEVYKGSDDKVGVMRIHT